MQTFQSGGALMIQPGVPLKSCLILVGIALAVAAIPPLFGVYLLLFT